MRLCALPMEQKSAAIAATNSLVIVFIFIYLMFDFAMNEMPGFSGSGVLWIGFVKGGSIKFLETRVAT